VSIPLFEFATASRVVFGNGAVKDAMPAAKSLGSRVLLVTGSNPARAQTVGIDGEIFPVNGEPTLDTVRAGVACAAKSGCDVVIGFGGGSAIDAGKAIAAMLANPGDVLEYLEVIGTGKPVIHSMPFIAVPTTAGTGAEVTRNAVLGSREHGVKVSLRSPAMLPRVAIVDPELTLALPPATTASTGLDALTQLIEPYVSLRSNAITDPICREGIRRVSRSIIKAFEDGSNLEARAEMSLGSLFGGFALANAGLGAVHGLAAAIGGTFPAPHGAVCAALLPHVMAANIEAMKARMPDCQALKRYKTLAKIIMEMPAATATSGMEWVKDICKILKIPGLATYGITADAVPTIVENAKRANSMKANPIELTSEELTAVVLKAL